MSIVKHKVERIGMYILKYIKKSLVSSNKSRKIKGPKWLDAGV